jgi:hypothetical protein
VRDRHIYPDICFPDLLVSFKLHEFQYPGFGSNIKSVHAEGECSNDLVQTVYVFTLPYYAGRACASGGVSLGQHCKLLRSSLSPIGTSQMNVQWMPLSVLSPQLMARLCSHVTYMSGDSWKQGNIDFTGEIFCSILFLCFSLLLLVALQGLTSKYPSRCI